jgi:hypothetical protein
MLQLAHRSAAATTEPATTAHHNLVASALIESISHIHVQRHEPHPVYLGRGATYFEAARMSRLMEHL